MAGSPTDGNGGSLIQPHHNYGRMAWSNRFGSPSGNDYNKPARIHDVLRHGSLSCSYGKQLPRTQRLLQYK